MTEQMEGLLGSSALVPNGNSYLHNQRLGLVVDLDERRLDKRFLYYLFNTSGVRHQINASASGTKVRHTAPERIYRVKFRRPAVDAQRKIAAILSAYDDLIENNLKRIRLLEESARLVFREWFVRLRFPGHEHTRITDGVPEGWEKKKLGEVSIINGETLRGSFKGQIEYVDISSVTPGSINETTIYEFEDAPGRARRVVKHGDIIWSCVRPNRKSHAVVLNPPSNMIASTGFAVISPSTLPTSYLYFATTTDSFVGYLSNRARGAAYPAVTASDFENAEIIFPQTSLIKTYDECVSHVFSQIHNLRTQNQKLKQARDLLLPRLMSGDLPV